jgi:hypothetical protein
MSATSSVITSSIDYNTFAAMSLSGISRASPHPSELPLPPQRWLSKDPSMALLDAATEEALDHYWVGQVKACQYAIFHMC